jgi:hypothetical protein
VASAFQAAPATEAQAGRPCAICQTAIAAGESAGACPVCASPFHEECWNENGGCAVYGCEAMPKTVAKEDAPFAPQAHWGRETKNCPVCQKEIKVAAMRCRFCGTVFETADPQSRAAFKKKKKLKPRQHSIRQTAVTLFVLCMIPCIAPLSLVITILWFVARRKELRKASALHHTLVIIGIIASSIASLMMVVVIAAGGVSS